MVVDEIVGAKRYTPHHDAPVSLDADTLRPQRVKDVVYIQNTCDIEQETVIAAEEESILHLKNGAKSALGERDHVGCWKRKERY